jgi:hypothetical protein
MMVGSGQAGMESHDSLGMLSTMLTHFHEGTNHKKGH